MASEVEQCIVYLEVFRDAQPMPDGPECVDYVLGIFPQKWFNTTSPCCYINGVLTLKFVENVAPLSPLDGFDLAFQRAVRDKVSL